MEKLNLFSLILGSLAVIGCVISVIFEADYLLSISTILMAICLITTVFISTKVKKNIKK